MTNKTEPEVWHVWARLPRHPDDGITVSNRYVLFATKIDRQMLVVVSEVMLIIINNNYYW